MELKFLVLSEGRKGAMGPQIFLLPIEQPVDDGRTGELAPVYMLIVCPLWQGVPRDPTQTLFERPCQLWYMTKSKALDRYCRLHFGQGGMKDL